MFSISFGASHPHLIHRKPDIRTIVFPSMLVLAANSTSPPQLGHGVPYGNFVRRRNLKRSHFLNRNHLCLIRELNCMSPHHVGPANKFFHATYLSKIFLASLSHDSS